MANLKKEDISKVADLARLNLDNYDTSVIDSLTSDLNNILKMVTQIQDVNTEGIKPMDHPSEINLLLRNDEITEENKREEMQKDAPETEAGLYLVPKVVEQG